MAGLTYDSGALIAAERNDRRLWLIHARALARGVLPVVPAVILAQVWRGGPQPALSAVLGGCQIEPLGEANARRAGAALGWSGTRDVPDAALVVSALLRNDAVVTSDRADIERIADAMGRPLNIVDI